jgi:hypothetical protein
MAPVKVHAQANGTEHEYQDAHRKIESGRWSARSGPEKNLPRLGKINDIHHAEHHAQNTAAEPGKLFARLSNLGSIIGRLRSLRGLISKRHDMLLLVGASLPLSS